MAIKQVYAIDESICTIGDIIQVDSIREEYQDSIAKLQEAKTTNQAECIKAMINVLEAFNKAMESDNGNGMSIGIAALNHNQELKTRMIDDHKVSEEVYNDLINGRTNDLINKLQIIERIERGDSIASICMLIYDVALFL